MSNPFVLSGLLSAWLVGPLYGMNVVIVTVIVQKLCRVRGNLVSRSLLLVTTLLISSCTAHAFTYLADLIDGMTSSFNSTNTSPIESANDYFQRATRAHVLACFFLYVLNSFCNNLFVAWRVYATWGRNKLIAASLAAFLTTLIIASVVVNAVCGHYLTKGHPDSFQDAPATALGLFTSGWILSIVMQILGALFISWHAVETPMTVNGEQKRRNMLHTLFYAFIEAGCLSLVTELVMIGFLYHEWSVALIFIAVLGQISGFSAFAIILREIYKSERDSSNGFVNVTSALAAMQMQNLTRRHLPRSIGPSDLGDAQEGAVMVDIETSRHEDDAEKPTFRRYRSPAVGKIVLPDIETAPSVESQHGQ